MVLLYVVGIIVLCILFLIIWILFSYRRYAKTLPKPEFQPRIEQPSPSEWRSDEVTITWIGHSTLLIRMFDLHILTDPVFTRRIGVSALGMKVGPKRHTEPALFPNELPEIDAIFLSHAHMDHLDIESLRWVVKPSTEIVTAEGTGRVLRRMSARSIRELGGTDSLTLTNGIKVTAVPVRHWGKRFPWNKDYGWTGFMIEYQGACIFFAGDTAHVTTFQSLREAHGPIDVACIPIGAYAPDAFQNSHCTPEQAWSMFLDTGARWLIPIHWYTFVLSQEPVDEPLQRLCKAAGDRSDCIVIRKQGEVFRFHPSRSSEDV